MTTSKKQIAKPGAKYWQARTFDDSGASAVEFAVVFPIFLLMTLAILAYGIYFGAAHSVQQLAADAARSSVPGLNEAERTQLTHSYVSNNAASYPLLVANKVTVTTASGAATPDDMVVTVRYDSSALPIWGFRTLFPLPSPIIERVAVIHRGGPQ